MVFFFLDALAGMDKSGIYLIFWAFQIIPTPYPLPRMEGGVEGWVVGCKCPACAGVCTGQDGGGLVVVFGRAGGEKRRGAFVSQAADVGEFPVD